MEATAKPANPASSTYRAVWISDTHLGSRDCKAELLLGFIRSLRCDTLYLLGDIVDLWAMKRQVYWPDSHQRVLDAILDLSRQGTRVIFIPGNHDMPLRNYAHEHLFGVEIYQRFVHQTADGKRLLLLHGDEFDAATRYNRLYHLIGDAAYDLLLWLNHWSHLWRRLRGKPYWSLAGWLKGHVGKARDAIAAFEEAAAAAAREYPADGIVCGHIHQPKLRCIDDTLYFNDGDWVENCTALAEDMQGRISLLQAGRHEPAMVPAGTQAVPIAA